MTATMLVSLLGQPRIFYQMAMDGLFPPFFSSINKNGIPGKVGKIRKLFMFLGYNCYWNWFCDTCPVL
jgi:amino acid permease